MQYILMIRLSRIRSSMRTLGNYKQVIADIEQWLFQMPPKVHMQKQSIQLQMQRQKNLRLPSMVEIPFGFWSEYAAEYLHKSGWSQSVGLPILPCFIAWNAQPVTEGSVIIIEHYYVTTQIIRQACIHSSVVARHERYKLPIQYSFQCNQVQTFFTFLNICQTNNSNFCSLSSRTSFSGSGSTFSFSIAECFAPRWHATKNNCACIIDNWENH